MSVTKDEVPHQIKVNNDQLIASFKELLKDTERLSVLTILRQKCR